MTQANATFSAKKWARKAWDGMPAEITGGQLSRIEISYTYQGDIEGEATVQYLIVDNGNNKGSFVALEKVTGSVGGRSGSFVFQHTGTFDNGNIKGTLAVIPGSGTDDLSGLRGQATIEVAKHLETYPITLEYEL
jgi:hypothetical protein